jgi:hypothetical protein
MSEFETVKNNIDINLIYDKLSKIEVPLERQQGYNRHYIDQKLVESDQALDSLDKINTQVVQELTNFEIRLSIIEEEIANKKRNELTNNKEILKKYSTGKERESAVELLIMDSMAEFSKLSRRILALKNLSGIIKTKQSIIIKKMRNIQDQSRMMSELLKVNVPLPDDKDTAFLMKNLREVEKLEESLEADEVSETSEYIEEDQDNGASQLEPNKNVSEQDATIENSMDIDISMGSDSSDSNTSEVSTGSFDIEMDLGLDSTVSQSSETSEQESTSETESDTLSEENTSESEESESELDMDSVLDGLDQEDSSEVPEATELSGGAVALEDIFSGEDAVVTDESAKKPDQGEPTSKGKSPVKSKESSTKSSKKVLKEDEATVPGDVSIDNILDDLGNL